MLAVNGVILIFLLQKAGSLKKCPDQNWKMYDDICYKPLYNHSSGASFQNAATACAKQTKGALLVMPKTEREFEFLLKSFLYLYSFWIGLISSTGGVQDITWNWIDGTIFKDYSVWAPGYPNGTELSNCVVMSKRLKGYWADVTCNSQSGVLCQMYAEEDEGDEKGFCRVCKSRCQEADIVTEVSPANRSTFNVEDLKLDKTLLSSFVRGKTSAPDPRGSSKVIGCTGIILIVISLGFIAALDTMPPNRFNCRTIRRARKRLLYLYKQSTKGLKRKSIE